MEEKAEIQILEKKALSIPEQAHQIKIVDEATLTKGNEILIIIKTLRNEINAEMDPVISKAFQAHRAACDLKRKIEQPLVQAENYIKPQIASYKRKLQEEIQREKERVQRELEEKKRREEELLKAAAEEEAKGDLNKADEIFEEAEKAAEETREASKGLRMIPKDPKLEKTGIRQDWKWDLEDFDQVPREWLCLDAVKINAYVRAAKDRAKIPGIRIYPIDVVMTRGVPK